MGTEGSRTKWFHSFPAVSHGSVQDRLVAAFQPASRLRRLVGCFSLIVSFWETYQRPFSSSKPHVRLLKIFPGSAGCSSSVKGGWDVETQMHKGQEQEGDDRWGLGPYRAVVLSLPLLVAFSMVAFSMVAFGIVHLSATPGYLGSHVHLWWGRGSCRGNQSRRGHWCQKKCSWRLSFFFFSHKSYLKKKKSGMYLLLFHLFYLHFSLGRGELIDRKGLLQNMSFSSCLRVQIQFPVLDPRLFSPVRRQLVWQSGARGGSAGSAGGVWSRAGGRRLPWLGGVRCAWGCLRVTGGSERSCESRRGGLPWLPSNQGCSQACSQPLLFHEAQAGTENELLFYRPQRGLWQASLRLPLLFDPPHWADPDTLALTPSGRWHSPNPRVAQGGPSPHRGAQLGHGTSTRTCAQGWSLHPTCTAPMAGGGFQEQEVATCRVFTACFLGWAFLFSPTTALRVGFGENLYLQETQ